ncbi:hypothetical protein [Neoaquamicrobium sediminum]|uniref:hypothetical protein n=1 Tax=Neoaquamicrobium sediminum TaxID=1849104 RepID=UPI00156649FE|nr:hypothetical protein [Mesorhizobium sediminum]NRC56702.1 hypothetical protein [Mesorhizobium sediminum]
MMVNVMRDGRPSEWAIAYPLFETSPQNLLQSPVKLPWHRYLGFPPGAFDPEPPFDDALLTISLRMAS